MEVWASVPAYEMYEVSNWGRFRYRKSRRQLNPSRQKSNGYYYVQLKKDGRFKNIRAHTLVLLAFVGARKGGEISRHLNGNRSNNRLDNLRWGTHYENYLDAVAHGTYKGRFVTDPIIKLQPESVADIRESLKNGELQKDIARRHGVHQSSISNIKRGLHHK